MAITADKRKDTAKLENCSMKILVYFGIAALLSIEFTEAL